MIKMKVTLKDDEGHRWRSKVTGEGQSSQKRTNGHIYRLIHSQTSYLDVRSRSHVKVKLSQIWRCLRSLIVFCVHDDYTNIWSLSVDASMYGLGMTGIVFNLIFMMFILSLSLYCYRHVWVGDVVGSNPARTSREITPWTGLSVIKLARLQITVW